MLDWYDGKEFGAEEEGSMMIIKRALYGLKSSGASYRAHFASTLAEIQIQMYGCGRQGKIMIPPNTYKYLLIYVENCLIVSHQPYLIITTLQKEYTYCLKNVGEPKQYLGAEIGNIIIWMGQWLGTCCNSIPQALR
jgi:hypothetical protein